MAPHTRKMGFVRLAMVTALLASGACSAGDSASCQPGCADDKRECRALAQNEAKRENGPLEVMNEKLPHIVGAGDARGRSIEVRMRERQGFENRRMERTRACDDKYMKCVRVCSGTVAEPDAGSVVLKPKGEL